MEVQFPDIWVAAGVIIGFQVGWFTWRISREVAVGDSDDLTWLPPADFLNLISMAMTAFAVFILPMLGLINVDFAKHAFALAVLLLIAYPFALAGHYDLYNRNTSRSFKYFPYQERVVVCIVGLAVLAFVAFWIFGG